MKRGLGKGLESIFGENYVDNLASNDGIKTIKLTQIEPKSDQPRKYFDQDSLSQLSESIATYGLIQPIVVRESNGGFYQIIAGERRWRAAKLAGLEEIPVIIMQADELKAAQLAIIENVQREDLNPFEEAQAYSSLMDRFGLTQEEVASQVGKSRSAIANTMRLLDLPEDVLEMLKTGDITAGHARALLGLLNKDIIVETAQKILIRSLSVRETEELVRKLNKLFSTEDDDEKPEEFKVDYIKELEKKAMSIIGKRIKINSKGKNKVIQIEYVDNEDLENTLIKLCGKSILDD